MRDGLIFGINIISRYRSIFNMSEEKRIAIDNLIKIEICKFEIFRSNQKKRRIGEIAFYFAIFDELNSKFFDRFKSHPILNGESRLIKFDFAIRALDQKTKITRKDKRGKLVEGPKAEG